MSRRAVENFGAAPDIATITVAMTAYPNVPGCSYYGSVSVDPANTVLERDESPWTSWALLLNAYQQAVCLM